MTTGSTALYLQGMGTAASASSTGRQTIAPSALAAERYTGRSIREPRDQTSTSRQPTTLQSTPAQVTEQPDVLIVRQQFHGVVTKIDWRHGEFRADLVPLLPDELENEARSMRAMEANFSIDEIPSPDRELLEIGVPFRWIIGRRVSTLGRDETVSSLYIRRLPKVTERMLRLKDEAAAQLAARLKSYAQHT